MDYMDRGQLTRHLDWAGFDRWRKVAGKRLVLLTTKGAIPHTELTYGQHDVLMVGQESCGVPEIVHAAADARVVIPLKPDMRSLNVAVAAAIVLAEALRQTKGYPYD